MFAWEELQNAYDYGEGRLEHLKISRPREFWRENDPYFEIWGVAQKVGEESVLVQTVSRFDVDIKYEEK